MASSRSGSNQTLRVGSTLLTRADGLESVSLTNTGDTISITSEGLTTVNNSGGTAHSGSFTCAETDNTNSVFLGKNGSRQRLEWTVGGTVQLYQFCILTISRMFVDRGVRQFQVDFVVDGQLTIS